MAQILVSILVDESFLPRFPEIVASCKAAGMVVQREMTTVGVISGTIEGAGIPVLSRIKGMRHVEPSRDVSCLEKPQ